MLGQLVKTDEIRHSSELKIDASALRSGMYFIKISNEDRFISIPFIKN